jgi:hypothetical protein
MSPGLVTFSPLAPTHVELSASQQVVAGNLPTAFEAIEFATSARQLVRAQTAVFWAKTHNQRTAHTDAHTCARTHAHTNIHIHACIHIYIHSHTHTTNTLTLVSKR